jgi:hypothetical protein
MSSGIRRTCLIFCLYVSLQKKSFSIAQAVLNPDPVETGAETAYPGEKCAGLHRSVGVINAGHRVIAPFLIQPYGPFERAVTPYLPGEIDG